MSIFNTLYDHQLIKKYTITFGSLFDKMVIIRKSTVGVEQERYTIPLSYSPKEKFIQRIMSDADLLRKEGITLPRMAFEFISMNYNAERKLSSKRLLAIEKQSDPNNKIAVSNPVAYDFMFNLYVGTKTLTDVQQIVEQIMPAFTPDYTVSMKVFDDVSNFHIDVPISLVGNSLSDSYEGEIGDKRTIIWQLEFILKGYLFGPLQTKPLIKKIDYVVRNMDEVDTLPDNEQTDLLTVHMEPVVDGKLLSEIYETDDWDVEVIFGGIL